MGKNKPGTASSELRGQIHPCSSSNGLKSSSPLKYDSAVMELIGLGSGGESATSMKDKSCCASENHFLFLIMSYNVFFCFFMF